MKQTLRTRVRSLAVSLLPLGVLTVVALGIWQAGLAPFQLINLFRERADKHLSAEQKLDSNLAHNPLSSLDEKREDTARERQEDIQRNYVEVRRTGGLESPDGLAVHPLTGEIFVTEEDAGRVSVLRDYGPMPVMDSTTVITGADGQEQGPIRSPEGLAFDAAGDMYVVEDIPGGRLLRFPVDELGSYHGGEVVSLPGTWQQYAWESVAVSSDGRILLGGSDVESISGERGVRLPTGAVLYRDENLIWWVAYQRLFSSISEVQFSKDERHAVYTCEMTGAVGWLVLDPDNPLGGTSKLQARSPEGLCVLPDGTMMVAEEGGHLIHLDPSFDRFREVFSVAGQIETVVWNSKTRELLVTCDSRGEVIVIQPDMSFPDDRDMLEYAMFYPMFAPRTVPENCPDFLAEVLAMGGLNYLNDEQPPDVSFRKFTSRVPLVAADTEARPMDDSLEDDDPLLRVQFVVFQPNTLGVDDDHIRFPLAAFAARYKSGTLVRTRVQPSSVRAGNFLEGEMHAMPEEAPVVPYPASVTVTPSGIAAISFLGLGQTDDYSLVINPHSPDDSYMVVFGRDGTRRQYKLIRPQGAQGIERWVIGYSNASSDRWQKLGPGTQGLTEGAGHVL